MTRTASLAVRASRASLTALALAAAACAPEPFALVGHDFGPPEGAKLNQPLVLSFNDDVDPGSARPGSVRVVRESDGSEVPGTLRAEGATVVFRPRLPLAPDLSDVALRPGERYRVEVPGLPQLRSLRGLARGALDQGASFPFATLTFTDALAGKTLADAPAELLFVDPVAGAPTVVWPRGDEPRLTKDGHVRLRFSEPLDPRAVASARFWLDGPWHLESQTVEKKLAAMAAQFVENEPVAIVELALVAPPPAPLAAGNAYSVAYEPSKLKDIAGHAVGDGSADSSVTLQFKP